ncbi:MAG: RNA polymerase sigma-54 factor, partial [Chitinophagaceae bacterium]
MSLNQSLQQKLLQKLSPQQIQLMKLLQVPTAILDDRIKEELEENPALELADEGFEGDETPDEFASSDSDEYNEDGESNEDPYENIDISDYVSEGDDDVADYKMRDENYGDQEEKTTLPYKVETSFYEQLEAQLGMLNLDDRLYKIAEQVIGSIDEDGYLRRET